MNRQITSAAGDSQSRPTSIGKSSGQRKLRSDRIQNNTPQTERRKVLQSNFVVPNVMIKIQKCEQPGISSKKSQ
jgi:hypothetical protein